MEIPETVSAYERERGKPRPDVAHSFAQTNLTLAFSSLHSDFTVFSELDIKLSGRRLTPDFSVYPPMEIDWTHDELYLTDPPHLTVLITTTGQPVEDLEEQVRFLISAGVQSCWLVQPRLRTVTVFDGATQPKTVSEGTVTDTAANIEVAIEDIFAGAR